jgi:hypothetical protein
MDGNAEAVAGGGGTTPSRIVMITTPRVTVSAKSRPQQQPLGETTALTTTPALVGQSRADLQPPPQLQQGNTMLSEQLNDQQANYIKEKSSLVMNEQKGVTIASANTAPGINYQNGRKVEPVLVSYQNYFMHREKLPQHYHPLVQYLEKTELKYHNDNLYDESPIGFPTRAQILREKVYHFPIIKSTPADKARYRRKLEEKNSNIIMARKKYDFNTYDNYSSHYFLTGGRYNR